MPGFVRSKKDEARWSKAKTVASQSKKKDEKSFTDQDWALVNHIYHNMKKNLQSSDVESIDETINVLKKASKRFKQGYRIFNPDEEDDKEQSAAADEFLRENDPKYKKENQGGEDYEEYSDGEDEEGHQRDIEEDLGSSQEKEQEAAAKPQIQKEKVEDRFRQPTKEELISMRSYTRPWEQRARETAKLNADPAKNPVLAHEGNIIEARNKWFQERQRAYQQLTDSPEYKDADIISQMELDDKFHKEWENKNPNHMAGAFKDHHDAHIKGEEAKSKHAAAKEQKIRGVLEGALAGGGEEFSLAEGLQHAGGIMDEDKGPQATIKQDPAAQFAMGNQEFIKQFGEDYNKKAKKISNIEDMSSFDEGSKKDVNRILGPASNKDPRFENFFSHYYPLIGMSARRVIKQLGLDQSSSDIDMSLLHEAGMHGLIQAMNDYDHDNPSKASFATHAGNKIRGLQMTALRNQDQIPEEIRRAQKKFQAEKQKAPATLEATSTQQPTPVPSPTPPVETAEPVAPKTPSVHDKIKQSGHPASNDMIDRLKRTDAQRAAQRVIVRKKPTGGSSGDQ